MIKAVELYCGIGGFAKACEDLDIEVTHAYDQNDAAIFTYNVNHTNTATKFNLEKFDANYLDSINVDFLWMSPPCQPYTRKGVQKDIEDSRSNSFLGVLNALSLCKIPPTHIGLENVEAFKDSQARKLLLKTLKSRDYYINETLLCPSELGVPNRRMRYYLCASLKPLKPIEKTFTCKELNQFINEPNEPF